MKRQNDSHEVVWHNPVGYDGLRDGPPYLPGVPYEPIVLNAFERQEVRAFVKQAAADKEPPGLVSVHPGEASPLTELLALLQALAMLHQSHHWSTRGKSFYGDHELYSRLYNESLKPIDQIAERAVGLGRPAAISAFIQSRKVTSILGAWHGMFGLATTSESMALLSLSAEAYVLNVFPTVTQALRDVNALTPGTTNLLEGVADVHETFVYLLRQRCSQVNEYTYDRNI